MGGALRTATRYHRRGTPSKPLPVRALRDSSKLLTKTVSPRSAFNPIVRSGKRPIKTRFRELRSPVSLRSQFCGAGLSVFLLHILRRQQNVWPNFFSFFHFYCTYYSNVLYHTLSYLKKLFRSLCPMGAKVLLDLGLPRVHRPAKGCTLIDGVFDVQSRSSLDQQSNNRIMAG